MSLHVRQLSGLTVTDDRSFDPPVGITDAEYLAAKAASHAGKDWVVVWLGLNTFEATKTKGENRIVCTRTFWID